jgi:hypothetical protein
MKCIEKNNKITRVSDIDANTKVNNYGYIYISKSKYKEYVGKQPKSEIDDEVKILSKKKNSHLTRSEKKVLKNATNK